MPIHWQVYLAEVINEPFFKELSAFVENAYQNETCYPLKENIFKIFDLLKLNEIKVVIIGQDPYHGDQTNYTLRLISRGYKIFTPMKPALFSLGKFTNEGQDIIDEEYHWRSEKYFDQSRNDFLKSNAMWNYNNIADGTYFGYWGAPDMESLMYAKDKMGYPDL